MSSNFNRGLSLITDYTFGTVPEEEVHKLAVLSITKPDTIDSDSNPVANGLYDLRMGPYNSSSGKCATCGYGSGNGFKRCLGHFGKIDLRTYIFWSHHIDLVTYLMRIVCHKCSRPIFKTEEIMRINKDQLRHKVDVKYIYNTLFKEATLVKDGGLVCEHCRYPAEVYYGSISSTKKDLQNLMIGATTYVPDAPKSTAIDRFYYGDEVHKIFANIPKKYLRAFGFTDQNHPKDLLVRHLLVMPPMTRPLISSGDGKDLSDNSLSSIYANIITSADLYHSPKKKEEGKSTEVVKHDRYIEFSAVVNFIADLKKHFGAIDAQGHRMLTGLRPDKLSVFSIINGKDGLIKGRMVGKRLNYTGRGVISAEVLGGVDHVGIPLTVAMIWTYPEMVTTTNMNRLRMYIMNGPDKYPGATHVIKKQNGVTYLVVPGKTEIEIGDVVERHVLTDDIILVNRQPTLHKYSVIAVKATVRMIGESIRLPEALTQPLNADYDGDEVTIIFPRNIAAIVEARRILGIEECILSDASGGVQILPEQNAPLAVSFLTRTDALYGANTIRYIAQRLPGPIKFPPPHKIIKGAGFWTGKQIVSIFLPDVSYNLPNPSLKTDNPADQQVVIKDGNLLSGILTTKVISRFIKFLALRFPTNAVAMEFINNFSNFANLYMVLHGSTFGIQDIIIPDKSVKHEIRNRIEYTIKEYNHNVRKMYNGTYEYPKSTGMTHAEFFNLNIGVVKGPLDNIVADIVLPYIRQVKERYHQLYDMYNFGTKGSPTSIGNIMSCIGLMTLKGQLLPRVLNGRLTPMGQAGALELDDIGFIRPSLTSNLMSIKDIFISTTSSREGKIIQQIEMGPTGHMANMLSKSCEDMSIRRSRAVRGAGGLELSWLYNGNGFKVLSLQPVEYPFRNKNRAEIEKAVLWTKTSAYAKFADSKEGKAELKMILDDKLTFHQVIFANRLANRKILLPVKITDIMRYDCDPFGDSADSKRSGLITPKEVFDETNKLIANIEKLYGITRKYDLERLRYGLRNLMINIRSYLYSRNICDVKKYTRLQFSLLYANILQRIRKSLIQSGTSIGNTIASAISAPTSQMVIDSFHATGSGTSAMKAVMGDSVVSVFRKYVNASSKMINTQCYIYGNTKYTKTEDEALREIRRVNQSNHFSEFVDSRQIVYLNDFEKDEPVLKRYSIQNRPGYDTYNKICYRFYINKRKLIGNELQMADLKVRLESNFRNHILAVPSPTNIPRPYMIVLVKHGYVSKTMNKRRTKCLFEWARSFMTTILISAINVDGNIRYMSYETPSTQEFNPETMEMEPKSRKYLHGIGEKSLLRLITSPYSDGYNTYTTHVLDVYEVLGIEAARNLLKMEMMTILDHVTTINTSHIENFCDNVTKTGEHLSITPTGLAKQSDDPFSVITFERQPFYITKAAQQGTSVKVEGVSASTLLGQIPKYMGIGHSTRIVPIMDKSGKPQVVKNYVALTKTVIDDLFGDM